MTLPPVVHPAELRGALDSIAKRHQDIDDQGFALIDCDNPYEVHRYLRSRPTRDEEVNTKDVLDAQILQDWLWHDLRRGEHTLLTRGEKLGIPLTRLGSRRGITGQGVRDRIDAGYALITYGQSDVHLTRDARRAATSTSDGTNPQDAWLITNHERLRDVAAKLLTLRKGACHDARTWLVEVEHDLQDDEWSRESPILMSLAWSYLRTQPDIFDKAQQHAAHVIGREVEALRRDFDNAGTTHRQKNAVRRRPPGRRRKKNVAGRRSGTHATTRTSKQQTVA